MLISGNGVLQPGDRKYELPDKLIKAVDFVVLRDRWKYMHSGPGKYDLRYLLRQAQRCRELDRPYIIGVMTGNECAPDWIKCARASWEHGGRAYRNVPLPWETELLNQYERLMDQIQLHFFNDPCWITGPTVASQEMHTNGLNRQKGYSSQKMVAAWKRAIQIVSSRFQYPILSISGQELAQAYVVPTITEARKLGPSRISFQHNSLGTQTSTSAKHVKHIKALSAAAINTGNEMVQPGNTKAIPKFPYLDYIVAYPDDVRSLPPRP